MEYLKKYWYLLVVVLLLLEYYVFQFTIFSKKAYLNRNRPNPNAKSVENAPDKVILLYYDILTKGYVPTEADMVYLRSVGYQ